MVLVLSKFKVIQYKDFALIGETQITYQSLTLLFQNFLMVIVGKPYSGEELQYKNERENYDKKFLNYIKQLKKLGKAIIVMGNFNAIIDPLKDKTYQNYGPQYPGQTVEQNARLKQLVSLGLIDTFRKKHPYDIKFSQQNFYNKHVVNSMQNNPYQPQNNIIKYYRKLRTDYIFVDDKLKEFIEEADILTSIEFNQHYPVILKINLEPN